MLYRSAWRCRHVDLNLLHTTLAIPRLKMQCPRQSMGAATWADMLDWVASKIGPLHGWRPLTYCGYQRQDLGCLSCLHLERLVMLTKGDKSNRIFMGRGNFNYAEELW